MASLSSVAGLCTPFPKAGYSLKVNNLLCSNQVSETITPSTQDHTGLISAQQVYNGVILSSGVDEPSQLTFPLGFASALVVLMGDGNKVGNTCSCLVVCNGSVGNTVKFLSLDTNTTFADNSITIFNGNSRLLIFRIASTIPSIVVY